MAVVRAARTTRAILLLASLSDKAYFDPPSPRHRTPRPLPQTRVARWSSRGARHTGNQVFEEGPDQNASASKGRLAGHDLRIDGDDRFHTFDCASCRPGHAPPGVLVCLPELTLIQPRSVPPITFDFFKQGQQCFCFVFFGSRRLQCAQPACGVVRVQEMNRSIPPPLKRTGGNRPAVQDGSVFCLDPIQKVARAAIRRNQCGMKRNRGRFVLN